MIFFWGGGEIQSFRYNYTAQHDQIEREKERDVKTATADESITVATRTVYSL